MIANPASDPEITATLVRGTAALRSLVLVPGVLTLALGVLVLLGLLIGPPGVR